MLQVEQLLAGRCIHLPLPSRPLHPVLSLAKEGVRCQSIHGIRCQPPHPLLLVSLPLLLPNLSRPRNNNAQTTRARSHTLFIALHPLSPFLHLPTQLPLLSPEQQQRHPSSSSLLCSSSTCYLIIPARRVRRPPHQAKMGSETETITFEGIPFPAEITAGAGGKPLSLLGTGITDIEIHFLQIKYNAIGVYLHNTDATLLSHLGEWKGKTADEILADAAFWAALVSSPVEKLLRVVVIKEIKGSQYGVQLESSVRDRLAAVDLYEDDEEEALEKVAEFFQAKYFKPGSVITFHFPATPGPAEITFVTEGKGDAKITVENEHVAGMIQKWYLGGDSAVSPTTVRSLADRFAALLAA